MPHEYHGGHDRRRVARETAFLTGTAQIDSMLIPFTLLDASEQGCSVITCTSSRWTVGAGACLYLGDTSQFVSAVVRWIDSEQGVSRVGLQFEQKIPADLITQNG